MCAALVCVWPDDVCDMACCTCVTVVSCTGEHVKIKGSWVLVSQGTMAWERGATWIPQEAVQWGNCIPGWWSTCWVCSKVVQGAGRGASMLQGCPGAEPAYQHQLSGLWEKLLKGM